MTQSKVAAQALAEILSISRGLHDEAAEEKALATFYKSTEGLFHVMSETLSDPVLAGLTEVERVQSVELLLSQSCPDPRLMGMALAIMMVKEMDRRAAERGMTEEEIQGVKS